jgi:hypothetical protein
VSETEPPIDSMLERTTSMPTPRPDTPVTFEAVEKPGSKMKRMISSSLICPSVCSVAMPLASAFALILSMFRPRPSSEISMVICPASCEAATRISPNSGLPAAMRSSGVSMPWSAQLRMRWVSGSRSTSMS